MLAKSFSAKFNWLVGLIFTAVLLTPAFALSATIYVDFSNSSGVEDGTIDNPFNTIQEGVNNAHQGDTVTVFSRYE
ncbi:MAG: hypothetical protein U5R30_15215 [Deltaproteobacteria bacterium]|nr:hypothetical protein [Deltaproteobacteria bacterium]